MKVLYVSSSGGIHDYRFLKKLVNDHEVLFLHYRANDIIDEIDNIDHLQIISKKAAFKSFPLLSETAHFTNIVKQFKPELIHTGYVWQTGILAAQTGSGPHLSMPWGSDILVEPAKNFLIKKLVNKVITTCDHVQCDAEFVKQKITDDYGAVPEKITVFPWGIDLELFSAGSKEQAREYLHLDQNKFIIIFNRQLENIYGVNYLLDAYKNFSAGKNDVMLLMLSAGSMRTAALRFITENRLENKIRLIGKVLNTELPRFLNAADIYVSPSLSDGSSLSLLEAMACGKGLVVSDVPAIKEWVGEENGIMIKRRNSPELTEAMEQYYNNRKLIEEHGTKNIAAAKSRADWDKNYLKLQEIYNKITA